MQRLLLFVIFVLFELPGQAQGRKSTASKNIITIDLNRKVWIYLPEGYHTGKTKYPVLYLHDGQNIFDDSTSFVGEWGIDEFMDTSQLKQSIIVAVSHAGERRINEYNPFDHAKYGKGEADAYLDYLVNTVRPYINKHYRTKKCRKNTWMAGSSMGGLVSMYGVLKYPKVFGRIGVFSPSFWVAPGIYDLMKTKGEKVKSGIYFYAGKHEDEKMVPDMLKAFEQMSDVSKARMKTVIRDDGKHNEATWRKEFPLFYEWVIR